MHEYCLNEVPCKISSSWFKKQLANIGIFGLVWLDMIWLGFEWCCTWVMSRCNYMQAPSLKNNWVRDDLRICGLVWYGYVWFGLVWNSMVYGYCLHEFPYKISSSWFEKQLSYGQYRNIWIGLVWLGQVWFSFEWYGTWVMSRCSLHAKFWALIVKND